MLLADQAFVPAVAYSHPPALNIGVSPAWGSCRVPVKVPEGLIVPVNSIPDAVVPAAFRVRSVLPFVTVIRPLSGETAPEDGFVHVLALVRVPSAKASRCADNRVPSASDPPVQGSVAVLFIVKDQLPVISAGVTAPPPPPPCPKRNGSFEFSQPAIRTNRVRAMDIGRT